MDTAGADLKIDISYKNFEEIMEELTGFKINKEIVFA